MRIENDGLLLKYVPYSKVTLKNQCPEEQTSKNGQEILIEREMKNATRPRPFYN